MSERVAITMFVDTGSMYCRTYLVRSDLSRGTFTMKKNETPNIGDVRVLGLTASTSPCCEPCSNNLSFPSTGSIKHSDQCLTACKDANIITQLTHNQ